MLQFSDTTNKNGIIQRIEFDTNLGDGAISGNATLLSQITSIINAGMSRATALIIAADGRWSWDDTAHTDQSVATTDIVSGQGDYTILNNTPNSTKDYLKVERVEIKNSAGQWIKLNERDLVRYKGSISQERTTSGVPSSYDFNGTSIFFDAKPSYDSTGGVMIWFSRSQINFSTTDTTKRPGFASIFHEYPVLCAVYHWEKHKGVGNPEQTKRDIKEMETKMEQYYGGRDKSSPNKINRRYQSFK